jgi:hypothetical protein
MIGDGQCRHLELLRMGDQLIQLVGAIQQAVLGVNVKMNEISVYHISFYL